MLILGDEGHYHGRFPWVTASLLAVNIIVYVAQVFLGEQFTNGFSLVPEEIVTFRDLQGTKYHKAKIEVPGHYDHKGHYHHRYETKSFPIKHYTGPFPIFLTLLTSMFMHADVFHLIGNMWFLLVFGRNVECAMNHGAIPGVLHCLRHVCGAGPCRQRAALDHSVPGGERSDLRRHGGVCFHSSVQQDQDLVRLVYRRPRSPGAGGHRPLVFAAILCRRS